MSFISDAKELLTENEFMKLELLGKKSANFETTTEEDEDLFELKAKVKKLVAERDRQKNMQFIKDGGFSLVDILKVLGLDKKAVVKAVEEVFPAPPAVVSAPIATYKIGEMEHHVKNGERLVKELSQAVQKGKEKQFVKNLTPFGKAHILESHIADAGPYAGDTIYSNLNVVAQRFKFNKEVLRKELGIVDKK